MYQKLWSLSPVILQGRYCKCGAWCFII